MRNRFSQPYSPSASLRQQLVAWLPATTLAIHLWPITILAEQVSARSGSHG